MTQRIFFQQQLWNAGGLGISFKRIPCCWAWVVPEREKLQIVPQVPPGASTSWFHDSSQPLIKLSDQSCSLSPALACPSWLFPTHPPCRGQLGRAVCRLTAPQQYAAETDCPVRRSPPSVHRQTANGQLERLLSRQKTRSSVQLFGGSRHSLRGWLRSALPRGQLPSPGRRMAQACGLDKSRWPRAQASPRFAGHPQHMGPQGLCSFNYHDFDLGETTIFVELKWAVRLN